MPVSTTVTLASVSWTITTLGWIVAPVASRLLNDAFARLEAKIDHQSPPENIGLTLWLLRLLWQEADLIHKDWATDLRSAFSDVEDIVDDAKYDELVIKV